MGSAACRVLDVGLVMAAKAWSAGVSPAPGEGPPTTPPTTEPTSQAQTGSPRSHPAGKQERRRWRNRAPAHETLTARHMVRCGFAHWNRLVPCDSSTQTGLVPRDTLTARRPDLHLGIGLLGPSAQLLGLSCSPVRAPDPA